MTRFAVFIVGICANDDGSLSLYGSISETTYSDIDELLYQVIEQNILGVNGL